MKMIRVIKAEKFENSTDNDIYNFLINYKHEDADVAEGIVQYGDYTLVDAHDEKELAYNFIHNVLGSFDEVAKKDQEKYFDFAKYAQLFIDSGEFTLNDNNEYVDSEGINSGTSDKEELGKFIFENFFDSNFENINKEDLEKCFNYEKFGKMLLQEADFYKLNDEYYIQC